MPHIRIWVHAVWATKNRKPLMLKEYREPIFQHIRENAAEKGIHIDHINGWLEHVHCLISLQATQNIATVMNQIKGESSYWINHNLDMKKKFEWQDEYWAASAGQSQIINIRRYIQNQEIHHAIKIFQKELDEYIEESGFEIFNDC